MKGEIISKTRDGKEVYVRMDTEDSHIHCAMPTLRQALSRLELGEKKFMRFQVPFDYTVGKDRCVEVSEADTVVLWQRPGRAGKTPMVLNRATEATQQLNVVIAYDETLERHVVVTAFLGRYAPQEPWDPNVRDREASEKFWASHALVPTIAELSAMKKAGVA